MQIQQLPIKRAIAVLVTILVLVIALLIYRNLQFHIVRTNPDLSSFNSITPYLTVDFNEVILDDGLRIDDFAQENIIAKTKISNKRLVIYFKKTLEPKTTYVLNLKRVSSIDGSEIINKKLVFTAKNMGTKGLSAAQQNYMIKSQDKPIYEVEYLSYPGFDSLTDYGMEDGQLDDLKQGLFDYSNSVSEQFFEMKLLPETIVFNGRSRDNPTDFIKVDFSLVLNSQTYKVHIEYQLGYDAVQLRIVAPDALFTIQMFLAIRAQSRYIAH